jgi:hypothetical protein
MYIRLGLAMRENVYKNRLLHTVQKYWATTQQTQVHLRLSRGSIHGSYCSNIKLGGMICGLLYVPIMCMQRRARPKVSLR